MRSSNPRERILPVFYDDNYLSLLPHEKRDVRLEYDGALLKGDEAKILVDGWNVQAMEPARRNAP